MPPDTLRWRENVVYSIRTAGKWVETRGDVLESGEHDCIAVSRGESEAGWILTHLPSGCRIVGMPSRESARYVAAQIVEAAPVEAWSAEDATVAAAHLKDVVTPILAGRRCYFGGKWRAGR